MPLTPTPTPPASAQSGRLMRRHVLMLALAVEILCVGAYNADRYRRPGITVDMPVTRGHVIV
ncbi:hypothetical protein [Methylorubrum extorquens]|uniref:hypothetical protein n=1 Tax=Methylorubrum extorquens TaxID=408 RepID=UPI0022380746|nr:hypothetical protein [Methylorubrum extorquens]UYW24596.1 hypothetical protein OKC48_15030 [Methylorubrum extorquens]UYW30582.1 hypothetical protein OKB92_16405 [Methylorubrum extorquens]